MPYQTILRELQQLKELKNNWYSVAMAVAKLKSESDGPRQPARRLSDASDSCGYIPNTLNRMLAVREFLDSVKDRIPELQAIDANVLPFTSLEVVKRLHQVDPKQGIRRLIDVATGRITIRRLREIYNSTVAENTNCASAHQMARFEMKDFEDTALKVVRSSAEELLGGGNSYVIDHPPFSFPISAVAFEPNTHKKKSLPYGFDFAFNRFSDKTSVHQFIRRTLFASSFFKRYWVLLPSTEGDKRIKNFCMILDEFDKLSIGVAVIPWGDDRNESSDHYQLRVIRTPKTDPSPDWTRKIFKFVELQNNLHENPHPSN